jgi:cell wall-associated NlpC family hydrolase
LLLCFHHSQQAHPFSFLLQMREDAIREHLTPHPANVASNLHLAANAAKSEAAAAQSPAEAQAAHVIKTAADAAKALPAINAAIEQNERECVPFCVSLNFLSRTARRSAVLHSRPSSFVHQCACLF